MSQRSQYTRHQQQEKIRVEFDEVLTETYAAIKIRIGTKEYWLPLSQVHSIHRQLQPYMMVTPWIAEKNNHFQR